MTTNHLKSGNTPETSRSKEFNRLREAAQKEHVGFTPGKRLEQKQELRTGERGPVKVWSFSTLKDFESCKYKVYLSKVAKAPRPPEHPALARGTRVHDAAEHYVTGRRDDLIKELEKFERSLARLRSRWEEGVVEVEQNWGFTSDWESVTWKDPSLWCRMKLDALVLDGDDSAYVIDYKTGKKIGNEIKHTDQGITYAVGTIMKYPHVQSVQVEFWYTDQGEVLEKLYNRNQLMLLVPHLEERAHKLTSCTEFEPSPSARNCKFCPHKETDSCAYAEGL